MLDPSQSRVHLIGIGGSGMSGLAAFLLHCGATVSGSDRSPSDAVTRLAARGAKVNYNSSDTTLPPDVEAVVASAAIAADHPELRAARARHIPVLKYAELLGLLMAHRKGLAIAGTHGKSTTTAWLTFVLRTAGLDPSFVIGADVAQLDGGSGVGDGPHFVAEACEYDRSFLNLAPHAAVILNVDEDHLDYYGDLNAIRAAFNEFAGRVEPGGLLLVNGDDPNCRPLASSARLESFGLQPGAHWRARDLQLVNGCYAYTLEHDGEDLARVQLGLPGRHNVMNSLAVAALALDAGADLASVCTGLRDFRGARRRLELRGRRRGVTVLDDYAHHPREIQATLAAARELYLPRRVWCIFQPHQHSRTRFLLEDFAGSFAHADKVVVPDIYFVRDSERERAAVCADDLVARIRARGGDAAHTPDFDEIVQTLAAALGPGDLVITMGAGDIWKVADALVERI